MNGWSRRKSSQECREAQVLTHRNLHLERYRYTRDVSSSAEFKASEGGPSKAAGTGTATDATESVTFELFLKEASEARRRLGPEAGTGDGLAGVEARIAALEKALGGGAVGGAGGITGGQGSGEVRLIGEGM